MPTAKELVDQQHDLLRRRDLADVAELYAPEGYYWMAGTRVRPAELPALMRAYLTAFPDIGNDVTGWIESADGAAVEQVITATHAGTLVTPFGDVAATGKRVRWESVEIVRVTDGKITSWRSYFDQLEVLAALGLTVHHGRK